MAGGLSRYGNVWETFFKESLNLVIGGDRTQYIIQRVERLPVPGHLKYVIIHYGTSNISKNSFSKIANSILCIALLFKNQQRIGWNVMRTLIISCFGLITYIFQNLEIKNLHHQFLLCYNSTKLYQRIQNLLVLVQLLSVNNSFYHSISVNLILNVTLLLTFPLLRMSNYILGYLGHFQLKVKKWK